MILRKVQKLLFYLIIFLIPCNLGKHWPQDWSYIHGILVDYLIPTFYLTDILIFTLLLTWFLESLSLKFPGLAEEEPMAGKNQKSKIQIKNKKLLYCFIVALLIITQLMAKNWQAAIYKLIKLIVLGLFAYWISKNIDLKKQYSNIVKILSLSVIWQSTLAIAQWIKQGSVFGYWFFGEQPYTSATLGVKKISLMGAIKVLPMGTFPHPNVLAGFLVISLIFILSLFARSHLPSRIKLTGLIPLISLILGIVGLGLTFSLPAWIILILVFSMQYLVFRRKWGKKLKYLFSCLLIAIYCLLLFYGLKTLALASITRRQELIRIAFKMWQSSPIFGVGLNNFIPRMEEFGRIITNYRFLQPVHNVFLLVLSETGIVGIATAVFSIKYLVFRRKAKKNPYILYALYCMFFLGLFDHYFLTIQQGMLVVSIVLGLTFN